MEGKKQDGEREWGETWQMEPSVPASHSQGLHGVRALCTGQCQPPGPGWLLAFMGRLGSRAELGRKVAKGLSLVFWCCKLVNKVGKGFSSSWYLFWCTGSSQNASLQGARCHAGRLTHEDGSNVCSSAQSCSCLNTT